MLRRSCSDILLNVDGGIPRFNLGGTGGNGPSVSGDKAVKLRLGSKWSFLDSVAVLTVSEMDEIEDESITIGS